MKSPEEGIRDGARALERLLEQSLRGERVAPAAAILHTSIVETVSQPGRGAPVVKYNPKRMERPSLPGDPPAKGKGELAESVTTELLPDVARVGPTLPIAAALEFGEPDGSVLPRPFMHRALDAVTEPMTAAVVAEQRQLLTPTGA